MVHLRQQGVKAFPRGLLKMEATANGVKQRRLWRGKQGTGVYSIQDELSFKPGTAFDTNCRSEKRSA
jgi:hypothetical protein